MKTAEFIEKWKWSAQGLDFSKELESDLNALLKEVAKDAYHAGFINKTPHTNFTGYWDQLNK